MPSPRFAIQAKITSPTELLVLTGPLVDSYYVLPELRTENDVTELGHIIRGQIGYGRRADALKAPCTARITSPGEYITCR